MMRDDPQGWKTRKLFCWSFSMRNRLTQHERLELGLFLGLAACLCVVLAAAIQLRQLPALSATEPVSTANPAADDSAVAFNEPPTEFEPMILPEWLPSRSAPAEKTLARKPEIKRYAGKEFRHVKTYRLRVTAYAPDPRCTYPYKGTTTASGLSVKTNGGKLVAADTSLIPMHSLVSVPGYAGGAGVPVLDRGGAIKGYRLDVMLPTYEAAQKWGSRLLDVKVYAPVKN
jgi:3D (Asp-Asp-Asp) domain-containing protein